jgi:hypothetical protein
MEANIRLELRQQNEDDSVYDPASKSLALALEKEFRKQCESIEILWGPINPPSKKFVREIQLQAIDKLVTLDIGKWLSKNQPRRIMETEMQATLPASPQAVARARWLRFDSEADNVELKSPFDPSPNKYPPACKTCGWGDFAQVPEPFRVSAALTKLKNKELSRCENGVFVVSSKVLSVLKDLSADDLIIRRVQITGRKTFADDWHAVRPKNALRSYGGLRGDGPVCSKCDLPARLVPRDSSYGFFKDFGSPACNLALVDEHPYTYKDSDWDHGTAKPHDIVISGGLFAALYNAGVKGLAWPEAISCFSAKPDQPTLEPTQRFVERFPGPTNKILKHKVKSS